MVPALQFDNWQWLVARARRARRRLGRAGRSTAPRWTNLRHGAATMDTLVSLGTLAAFGWSLSRCSSARRRARHADPFDLTSSAATGRRHLPRGRGRRHDVPAGRPLLRGARQAPGGRRAARAARARRQGGRGAARRRRGAGARSASCRSATASWSAPARRSPPTASSSDGTSAVDASMLTGESVPVEVGPGDAVVGAMHQRRRPAGRARHPRRRRHPARPDGPARRGRAERQGRGPAAGRPGLGRVRAGRDRARGRDAGLLARARAPGRAPRSPPRSPC